MADSWEDWDADDSTLVAGIDINAVDESKFAGEDQGPAAAVNDGPRTQPRKAPVESKYADKDRAYAAKTVPTTSGDDKAAIQAAQEAADLLAAKELFSTACKLDAMLPKSNAEFDEYVQQLFTTHVLPHKNAKQWKYFIKALVRAACEPFNKEDLKEIEGVVAGVRSDKVKADLAAAKEARKGTKKNVKLETDDIAAAMDYRGGTGVNNDDDFDFM